MEVRKGFKQTEVGVIPENWDVAQLGEILKSTQLGGNYKNGEQETNYPLIKMGNLDRGSIKLDKMEFIDYSQIPSDRDKLENGDVLFNTRNTLELVGKVAIWRGELPEAYFNSNIMRMKFDENRVSSNYFMNYVLNTLQALRGLRSIAIGTTSVAAIYSRDLVKVKIPLPTLAEQEAIAEALSNADALIESLETLLAKKRQVKQGAMSELLSGKRRLHEFEKKKGYQQTEIGEIPNEWNCVNLSSLCTMKSGEGITSASIDSSSIYPCYGGNGLRGFTKRYTHDGEYALIGRVGALCGNVLGVSGKFFASEHAIVVTVFSNVDVHWITYVLGEMHLNQYSEASAQPVLTVSKLIKLKVVCPPTKAEQTAIAEILSDMDAEIRAVEEKLSKARAVKAGMMSELLSGKIRLVKS